jgi:hypothetical protein
MQDGTPEDSEAIIIAGDHHEEQVTEDGDADLLRIHKLLATTDAMVWAQEWCIVARKLEYLGKPLIDEGWMVGWFANAIETGRDAGYHKALELDGRGRE